MQTLRTDLNDQHLKTFILQLGKNIPQQRQVWHRIRDLFPSMLKELILKQQRKYNLTTAKAERLAFLDGKYEELVDEYLKLRYMAEQSQILYKTHQMLIAARRSSVRITQKASKDFEKRQ